jgi:leucyl aminopeptidase
VALLGIFLLGPGLSAATAPDLFGQEGIWITLGADAFDTLVELPDLRFDSRPLARVAEASGVVVTRVHAADLDRISAEMHEVYRRCAGFMVHPSLAAARQELARLAEDGAPRVPMAYTIDQGSLVNRLEAALEEPPMLDTIDHLSNDFNNRYHAHPSGTAAAQWIFDQWQTLAQGRPDVTVELYAHTSTPQPSVILTIPGVGLPDEFVVLGGHLDSTASGSGNPDFLAPGADDDASGIAVLTEVIRVAMAEDFRPRRTVQFMAYAAEEIGLVGSGEIATAYQAAAVDVVAVLQLDMTDYFGSVEDIWLLSEQWTDTALTNFLSDLVEVYLPELQWSTTACGYGCSDHASWDSRGYPAAMPFEARFGQHNPEIHTTDDTLATLGNSVAHAHKFARLGVAYLVEVAKSSAIFADGFESGTTDLWSTVVP